MAAFGIRHVRRLCTHTLGAPSHSFITTPIFYVNAAPHVGHLYSALLADASHRWQTLKGAHPAMFSTGTDEHGLKVQQAAAAQNCTPIELCDRVSRRFKELFTAANISYTDYIRTTERRHIALVEEFWQRLNDRGHIYKGTYEGWYSVSDETFLGSSQITDGPTPGTKVSMETGHVVEWSSEDNYLFKLTAFREQLLDWVNTQPYPIIPEHARQQVVTWLTDETTSDLSVSRPSTRLSWGIPVPTDQSQTMYVWLDALLNYLTVSGYPSSSHQWPATAHVVGKDILRFHAVYWPAFLLAAGLEMPKKIVTHAHWTMGRMKMSKSRGNVVDPFDQISQFGLDPMRYFLLKEGSLHHDGDYSEDRVGALLNLDLADTLGNLLLRVTSRKLHPQGPGVSFSTELFPLGDSERGEHGVRAGKEDYTFVNNLIDLPRKVDCYYDGFEFNKGITAILGCLHQTNQFLERHKPWLLAKHPLDHSWLQTVLAVAIESLRLSSCLLSPIIPHSSTEILARLGFSQNLNSPDTLECLLSGEESVKRLERRIKLKLGGEPVFRKL